MISADDAPPLDRVEAGEVGGEGGSLTIVAISAADGWRYRMVRDESILRALLSKEDRVGLEFWHQSDWVDSWEAALTLLDQYPWPWLSPLQVHPELQARTWAAVGRDSAPTSVGRAVEAPTAGTCCAAGRQN